MSNQHAPFAREITLGPDSSVTISAVASLDRTVAPAVLMRRFRNGAAPGQPPRWEELACLRIPRERLGPLITALLAVEIALGSGG